MFLNKKYLLLIFTLFSLSLFAQVGINTEDPKATLHILEGVNTIVPNGLIAPNLTRGFLISEDSRYGIPQKGAIVYVSDLSGTLTAKTNNITSVGYYYFDGSVWQSFRGSGSSSDSPWYVQNTTNKAANNTDDIYQMGRVYVGTSDSVPSAIFNVSSTNKGILFPQMNSVQRDNIANPAVGLTIYNTDNLCLEQYRNNVELWYNMCSRTITGRGNATLECGDLEITGASLRLNEAASAGYTVTIPYTNGNGGKFNQTSFNSVGINGLVATIQDGYFQFGSGTLTFSITGTPTTSVAVDMAVFNITVGDASCSFALPVGSSSAAANCDTQIGKNIPTYPLSFGLEVGGRTILVSKRIVGGSGEPGVTPSGNFCGTSLRDDGSAVRLGRYSTTAVSSLTLVFSKPINNVTIISNWYSTNDAHSLTTNSSGTISPVNILSTCTGDFTITGGGTSAIQVKCKNGANNKGLAYIVHATKPYTEITISNLAANGDTNYDDIIVAFGTCDAYVVY